MRMQLPTNFWWIQISKGWFLKKKYSLLLRSRSIRKFKRKWKETCRVRFQTKKRSARMFLIISWKAIKSIFKMKDQKLETMSRLSKNRCFFRLTSLGFSQDLELEIQSVTNFQQEAYHCNKSKIVIRMHHSYEFKRNIKRNKYEIQSRSITALRMARR